MTLIALIVMAAAWYSITRAPCYLPPKDAATPAPPDGPAHVFGFATLTNPLVRLVVIGRCMDTMTGLMDSARCRAGRTPSP